MKVICRKVIYSALVIVMLWYLLSMLLHTRIVPSPFVVIPHACHIFLDKILIHCLYSLKRIILGILTAVAVGWPLGIIIGYNRWFDKVISPLIYFFYPVPKIALLPIIMLIFGLGESSKILIIFIIIIFQILIAIRDFVKNIDEPYYYPLIAVNAHSLSVFRHILIPASLPRLLSSIRIALATSMAVLFFAETFGTTYGLGYFIMDAMLRIHYVDMYSGIFFLSIIGFSLFAAIDLIEKKIITW